MDDRRGSIHLARWISVFITEGSLDAAIERLRAEAIEIVHGPVAQKGALGDMTSVYFRDPEGNLLEIASYGEH